MRTLRHALPATLSVSAIALIVGAAIAAPPPADTVIGNQASASYVSNGQTFTVRSNVVETVVNEIAAVEIAANQTRGGAPGGFVFFPHTINNDGNADDIYDLSILTAGGTDNFALSGLVIYADADQDGVPDSLTPITLTPAIAAGGSFGIVVRAEVPSSVNPAGGPVSDFDVTVTSQNDNTVASTVTDIVQASSGGLIDLQKSQVLAVDADADGVFSQGDTVEVVLTYRNMGISASTNVVIEDVLPVINADGDTVLLTYDAGSGRWSDTGVTVLTDAADGDEQANGQGENLDFSEAAGTITATFDQVAAGRTGTIRFRYVLTTTPEGQIDNVATVTSDDQLSTPSNGSPVVIAPTSRVGLADAAASAFAGGVIGDDTAANLVAGNASTTDDDGTLDDVVTESADIYPGGTMAFDLVLTNLGDATDTFEVSISNNDFPAGTVFELVGSDGATPVVGNRVTLGQGNVTHVQVLARIPTTASAVASPAGYDASITARSVTDPAQSNAARILFAGAVIQPPIDLENTDGAGNATGATGTGAVTNGGDAWSVLNAAPGTSVDFPMSITLPAGAPANTFELRASMDASFANIALPAGWTVRFFNAAGVEINSTGAIAPTSSTAASFNYTARVFVAANAPASAAGAPTGIYFRAVSPVNGALDSLLNGVFVNEVVNLEIKADTSVQAAPGGVVVIPHTIRNLGNSTVTAGALSLGVTDPFTGNGLTAALYHDVNNDGVLDGGDTVITDISAIPGGLAAGGTARLFVRAQVPGSATFGLVETGDVTVSTSLTTSNGAATDSVADNNRVIDTVSVISGDVTMVKESAIDAACAGPNAGTVFSANPGAADPGDCIIYRITVDNTGTDNATGVVMNDIVPDWTTVETCGGACTATLVIAGAAPTLPAILPGDEASGLVASSAAGAGFTLLPGARARMTFTVQIDE